MALNRGHAHDIRPNRPHASAFEEELRRISQSYPDDHAATIARFLGTLRQAAHDAGFYQASDVQPAGFRWYPNRVAEHADVFAELRAVQRELETRRAWSAPPLDTYLVRRLRASSPSLTYLVDSLYTESQSRITYTQDIGGWEYL